jgi:hypothetical protein
MIVAISLPTPRNCRLALPAPSSRSYPANSSSSGASCTLRQDQIPPHRQTAVAPVHHELPGQPPAIGVDTPDLEHDAAPASSAAFTSTAPSRALVEVGARQSARRSRRRQRTARIHRWYRKDHPEVAPAPAIRPEPGRRRPLRWSGSERQDTARHSAAKHRSVAPRQHVERDAQPRCRRARP